MKQAEKRGRGRTLNKLPELSESTQRRRTPLRRLVNAILAPLIAFFMQALHRLGPTTVLRSEKDAPALQLDRAYVFAGWHEQLLGACEFMAAEVKRGRRVVTLISPSVDGDVIADVAMRRGSDVVRGSATRSGFGALRSLIAAMRKLGSTSYVVTDGPKGPARESKSGVVMLARMSHAPLVPLVCVASREKRFRSWDRMRLARPFARKIVLVGEPRAVDRDLDEAGLERVARELDEELERLTEKAERLARSSERSG